MHIRIDCIVGARPNFIKMAAIMDEVKRWPRFKARLIHTGQHYSADMSDTFFEQLQLPKPDVHLGISAGTPTAQTADMLKALETVFTGERPDLVLVVGDVTSTVSAALVAVRHSIPVAHVEAGLRSGDRGMPEEINRLVTDVLSDFLFASERTGVENLRREGVPDEKVFLVGNVMIDTLLRFRHKAAESRALEQLGVQPREYTVATLHRPSNVDDPEQLRRLLNILGAIGSRAPVVFPVHPRTQARMQSAGIGALEGVIVTPPMTYLDFLHVISNAKLVLTDSGGIQEETTILQVPCLTLRENTERPVTITNGSNRLAGTDPDAILSAANEVLDNAGASFDTPEFWDGKAASRIFQVLDRHFT